MSQWGPIFYEDRMRIGSLVGTAAFEAIKPDSLIEALVILDGVGDIDSLRNKYVGMTYDEFKREASISNEVSK